MNGDRRVRLLIRQAADVPTGDDAWLAPAERAELARFRIDKRRNEWRLGRWTAKHLLATELRLDSDPTTLARIEVQAANDGAPEPWLDAKPLDIPLSISHSAGTATAATADAGTALGCDIELIRALRRGTVERHFTVAERSLLEDIEPHDWAVRGTMIWTAKESALKALREGLRIDTCAVEVATSFDGPAGAWRAASITHLPDGRVFHGWWRRLGDYILSVAADPPSGPPDELRS
ncbi:MAG: 4'-phosphopantetheinyl transferase superfamily protein [Gemmatimonadota bacterium]|jgi:4'-phosphopantetheinyl transferase